LLGYVHAGRTYDVTRVGVQSQAKN